MRPTRFRVCLLICAIGTCLTTIALDAQTLSAVLTGRVTDASGAVLPGVSIVMTRLDTDVTEWQGVTDQLGLYRASSLPPGRYDVILALSGFKTATVHDVSLQVDQRLNLDARLETGGIRESVTVAGNRFGLLDRQSGSLGLVVDTAQLRGLPLPGRSVLNLLPLAGGVSAGGPASSVNAAQLSITGSRTLNNEFMVDGVSILSGSTGGPTRLPSAEALREFKVLTSSYSAEYGRTSGGFVNVVVDSGTNSVHGRGYEFFRNQRLNANDYFRTLRGESKPVDRSDQYGGTFGGPLTVPGLFDGRNRLFFFTNYEALRRKQPSTQTSTIPDLPFRTGDFSASPVQVIDPRTGQPFVGNRIPSDRLDPSAVRVMNLLPGPNATGSTDAATGRRVSNYILDETIVPTNDEFTGRIDYTPGAAQRMFGRFTYYHLTLPSSRMIPGALDPALGDSTTDGVQAAFGWTRAWTDRLLGEVTAGYMRDDPRFNPPSLGIDVPGVLGIERSAFATTPRINVTGYSALGVHDNTYRRQASTTVQVSGALTRVVGRHSTKGGVQLRLNGFDVFNPGAAFAGVYNFNGEVTSATKSAGNPVNALADFLLGAVQTATYDVPQPATVRRNANIGAYVQDDWRATPSLTLNLGLRYDYESPIHVDDNIYSRVDPSTGRLLVAGVNASSTLNLAGDALNFGPRLGAAYSVNDRTVVRAGAGLFYSQLFSNLGAVVLFPGFTVRQSFPDQGVGIPQVFTFHQGHPLTANAGAADPLAAERDATPQSPLGVSAEFAGVQPLPSTATWNVGIQRELSFGTVDVNYVASQGRHLPRFVPFNQVPYDQAVAVASAGTALAAQLTRPFPSVASFSAIAPGGSSSYRALQAMATRRFGGRYGMRAAYTWSRSMDDGSGLFSFSQPYGLDGGQFIAQFPEGNRSLSSFDRPHVLSIAAQYTTGGPRWARGLDIAGVLNARSGLPDTIIQTNLHPDAGQQRPGVINGNVGGYATGRMIEGTAVRYLLPTTAATFPFVPVGPLFSGSGAGRIMVLGFGQPGNLGRNTTREPGEFNVDLSIARRIVLSRHSGLTLRVEAFNAFNRVNLNGPDTTLNVIVDPVTGQAAFNAPNFGLITTAKPPRTIQLALRVDF